MVRREAVKTECTCGCPDFEIRQYPLNEIERDMPDSTFPDAPWYARRDRTVVEVLCKVCGKIILRAYRYGRAT